MAKAKHAGVWGIDLGQCALKAMRLEVVDGAVTATAFDYVEYPKILSQPDADPDALTREALEKFLSRNPLRGDRVAISVPGQSGLARFVKLPPVEEKKIPEIVRFEAKQQIPFPLEEVIWDFQKLGSGAVTDGFAMETEIGLFAMKRDMINRFLQYFKDFNVEVHVVQMAPLALCNFISYDLLKKGTEDEPGGDQEEKEDDEDRFKKRCVVALDIGTDSSNLVITDGERIIWQRPIPHGGNHFTRALTKDLKLTFAKAEHVKRNATKSPDLKKILSSLKPVLTDFVGEVQRSLGYFTNTHRDAKVAYMIGLGNAFRLPGLQKFLSEKLQVDVRKLQKLQRLAGDGVINAPSFTQNVLSFAVAYGLSLQGLKLARLQTNLLPQDIQVERMVRAKKPWAVTAAAALLIGTAAMALGYAREYRAVADDSIVRAIQEGEALTKDAQSLKSQVDSMEGDVKKNEEAVRSIVAGQDERTNWLLLNRFVDQCLPVPAVRIDGTFKGRASDKSTDYVILDKAGQKRTFPRDRGTMLFINGQEVNLEDVKSGTDVTVIYQPDKNAVEYWKDPQAREAFFKFWERQTGATSIIAKPASKPSEGRPKNTKTEKGEADDEEVEYLIQVNLEAMDARYSSDLKSYFQLLGKKKSVDLMQMTSKDKNTPPEGSGWVVELRGYTYHKAPAQDFLVRTLLRSLQTRATPPSSDTPAAGKENAATPAASKDEGNADHKDWDRVIQGQISHVVLYDTIPDESPDPGFKFKRIGSSVLPALVANTAAKAAAATGGSSMGTPMGNTGMSSGGDSWTPLTSSKGNGTGFGTGTPTGGAGSTEGAPTSMMPGTGSRKSKEKEKVGSGPTRTEFIILFIWKEPTPSDDRAAKAGGGIATTTPPTTMQPPATMPPMSARP